MDTTETTFWSAVGTDPLTVLRRMLDEGFAGGRTEVVDELCSPDLIEHQFGFGHGGTATLEKVKQGIREVHQSFPDLRFEFEQSIVDGDLAFVIARGRGTCSGPFFGPPSGRPVDFTVMDAARVVDGRIVEHWGVPDRFALLVQTGVLDRLQRQ